VSSPIVDVLYGPVAPGSTASLSGILRLEGPCDPPVTDDLVWTVTALDLPAPGNVASCPSTVTCSDVPTGVGDAVGRFSFGLVGSHPFRGEGRFRYTLPACAHVEIEVFGVRGERLRTLVDREQEAGAHEVSLRLRDRGVGSLGPGVYLVRITAGREVRSLRVVGLD
jgi:hypothetical protein